MEVFDDVVFADFCHKRNLVPEKYVLFYIRWIKRFLAHEPGGGSWLHEARAEDRVLEYVRHLRSDGHNVDWQVEQARRAVELVLGQKDSGQKKICGSDGSFRLFGLVQALQIVVDSQGFVPCGYVREVLVDVFDHVHINPIPVHGGIRPGDQYRFFLEEAHTVLRVQLEAAGRLFDANLESHAELLSKGPSYPLECLYPPLSMKNRAKASYSSNGRSWSMHMARVSISF